MTAAERLVYLSGLSGVSAATHWRTLAAGITAGAIVVAFSGLPTATAAEHLLHEPAVTPTVEEQNSGGWPEYFNLPKRKKLVATNNEAEIAAKAAIDAELERKRLELFRAERRDRYVTAQIKALLDKQDALKSEIATADAILTMQRDEEEALMLILALA